MSDFITQVMECAVSVRAKLSQDPEIGQFIDLNLPIPRPFMGIGAIKLIIIGQDPTVQNINSRRKITTTLNLDKPGSLRTYVITICQALGLSLDENIYATNLCKNFFTNPPTKIKDVDVVQKSGASWLPVVVDELAEFPNVPVISLGEPILRTLINNGSQKEVGYYWGYDHASGNYTHHPMCAVLAEGSAFSRLLFPFPHQTSLHLAFYRDHLIKYLEFVKTYIGQ